MSVIGRRKKEKLEKKRDRQKGRKRKIVNLAYLAEHGFQYLNRLNSLGF